MNDTDIKLPSGKFPVTYDEYDRICMQMKALNQKRLLIEKAKKSKRFAVKIRESSKEVLDDMDEEIPDKLKGQILKQVKDMLQEDGSFSCCFVRKNWIPSIEDIKNMESLGMIYFLLLSVLVLEREYTSLTEDEKKQIQFLNRVILKNIVFVEKKTGKKEKQKISYTTYENLVKFARNCGWVKKGWLPSEAFIKEYISPNIQYCFGFVILLLVKNEESTENGSYRLLRTLIHQNYELERDDKRIQITCAEYEEFCKKMSQFRIKRERWLPTKYEIEKIIVPNIEICFDFVIWILETGPAPYTEEEKEIFYLLNRVLQENMRFVEGEEIAWL